MSSELKEAVCVCVWKGGGWGLQAVLDISVTRCYPMDVVQCYYV